MGEHGCERLLVAITVHAADEAGIARYLEKDCGFVSNCDGSALEPSPVPPARWPSWPLLGFDVIGDFGVSGLSDCGYANGEREISDSAWARRLNDHHLFRTFADAQAFCAVADARVPEHAPFYVHALWHVA